MSRAGWVVALMTVALGACKVEKPNLVDKKDAAKPLCVVEPEICGDGVDNNCNGQVDEGFDVDQDKFKVCELDCNDRNASIYPGAPEVANGIDEDCDGRVDNNLGGDADGDGFVYPEDCDDAQALIGPGSTEMPGDEVDNNCNGEIDEQPVCDELITGNTAMDFARAIGVCDGLVSATYQGHPDARKIRTKFGDHWSPLQGRSMVMISSGKAVDKHDSPNYTPYYGHGFGMEDPHPRYSAPRCGGTEEIPKAQDLTMVELVLKVPKNARTLKFQLNYFSAEYPEYVCQMFNDRFIALLTSTSLDPAKLPADECEPGAAVATCNISYDELGQPITVNNGFFDICQSATGDGWSNTCGQPLSLLAKTGYDGDAQDPDTANGATGWLTTKVPVKPGETITLRFFIFDEGDDILDSAVLLDNFTWEGTTISGPVTTIG